MKRKMTAFLLTFAILICALPVASGAAAIPTSIKAPASLVADVTHEFPYSTTIYFSVDSELLKFIDDDQTDYEALGISSLNHTAQIDWKLNNGNWHYTQDWDTNTGEYSVDSGIYDETGYLEGDTTDHKAILDLRNGPEETTELQRLLGNAMIRGTDESGEGNRLDLQNNTFYFRVRLWVSYYVTDTGENKYIISPWSEVLTYGKGATTLVKPTKLEKPTISNPVVGKNNDGSPKITFTAVTPKQVQDADNYIQAKDYSNIEADHQININNTGWVEAEAGAWWLSGETRSVNVPATYDNGKVVQIDSAFIQIRMRYIYGGGPNVGALQSEWSNVISVNTPSWTKASTWATEWLQKADSNNLIPDCLLGADMTQPITRAEFAALSVKLYEDLSGSTAAPATSNPFTDTSDAEILKAVKIGITNGTSPTQFSPKALISREQAAAMLTRAYKASFWEGWTLAGDGSYTAHTLDYSGVAPFADDAKISPYAKPSVYFMVKNHIINGVGNNMFAPNTTNIPAGSAVNYGRATREEAIKIAVATSENLK